LFTILAVLTLALGIGSNTALFSAVYGVLLRPLPFRDPDRLVLVSERARQFPILSASYQNFRDWQTQGTSFEEFGAARSYNVTLIGHGEPEQIPAQMITGNLLHLLGVQTIVGRNLSEADDARESPAVALIGYGLWQRTFGASSQVTGQTITLNNRSYTIIGVLPRNFQVLQQQADVVLPMTAWALTLPDDRSWHPGIFPIARLRKGVQLAQARAEMSTIAKRLMERFPDTNIALDAVVNPMHEQLVSQTKPVLVALLCAVAFVLLIACANIANLLLARATARRREMSIRMALGASNWRMLRQLTMEGVLLSGMGAAAGIALAYFTLPWLVRMAGSSLPAGARISIDSHVLLFTCVVSICVGVFFGVAPFGTLRSVNVRSALSDNERGSVSHGVKRLRNVLVVTEVCFAVLLLIGAGLFLRTLNQLSDVSLGFSGENILIADLPTSSLGPAAGAQAMNFYDEALNELRKLPGVEAAGAASFLPVSGQGSVIHFNIQGRPPHNPGEYIMANYRTASAGYFETLRIPLLQGRWITDADRESSPAVVVINRSMAQTYFRDESPLGKRMQIGTTPDETVPWMTIVGVVGDVKQSLVADAAGEMYVPFRQANAVLPVRLMSVVLRTHADPIQSATELRAAIHRLNANQPVVRIRTMQENVGQNFTQPRFRTVLLVSFAGLALVIAAVGIYGVMAYATQQRSAEMAIRMALGSSAERIFLLVVKDGLRLTLIGAGTGMILGLVFARYVKSLLFGVESTDAVTLGLALAMALITGMAASVLPARRASQVGIAETLRHS